LKASFLLKLENFLRFGFAFLLTMPTPPSFPFQDPSLTNPTKLQSIA
jgi:hypothetical protein